MKSKNTNEQLQKEFSVDVEAIEKEVVINNTRPKRKKNFYKKTGDITDAELLYRLRVVEQAIIDGKRGAGILEALSLVGRTVHVNTMTKYINMVRDKWEMEDFLYRPIRRERQLRKCHEIALKIEQKEAWGHWIQLQKLIADLEGNLAPVKVEHTHRDQFEDWTTEELKAFVESKGKAYPDRFGEGSGTHNLH